MIKVKVIFKPRPRTRPDKIQEQEIECTHVERNYQSFPGGPKWAVFHHPKGNWQFLETIIVEIKMEEF